MDLTEIQTNLIICFQNFQLFNLILGQSPGGVLQKDCPEKIRKNYLKVSVLKLSFLS